MNTNTIVDDIRINTILILTLFTLLVAHATLGDSGRDLLFGGFVIIAILIILAYLHITIFSRNIYYILIIIYI